MQRVTATATMARGRELIFAQDIMKFTEWDISTFITWEIRDGDTVTIYLIDFYNRTMQIHQYTQYSPCGKSRSLQKSFPNSDEETMLKSLYIKASYQIRFIDVKVLLGVFDKEKDSQKIVNTDVHRYKNWRTLIDTPQQTRLLNYLAWNIARKEKVLLFCSVIILHPPIVIASFHSFLMPVFCDRRR